MVYHEKVMSFMIVSNFLVLDIGAHARNKIHYLGTRIQVMSQTNHGAHE